VLIDGLPTMLESGGALFSGLISIGSMGVKPPSLAVGDKS